MSGKYYKTAYSGEEETLVNKSRFICYIRHVEDFAEVETALAAIRKAHPSATHVCFGCITDMEADNFRYGDDGEPTGTAGQPILAVLRGEGLCMTLAAVVRYFGGIKLGTGGLARAYSDSVKNALKSAEIKTFTQKIIYKVSLGYDEYNAILPRLQESGVQITGQNFSECVTLEIALDPEIGAESFMSGLLKREVRPEKTDERFV